MKPHSKISFHVRARILAAMGVLLALSTAQMTANDNVPASILNKLDDQLVLVVKNNRGQTLADKLTTREPDVFKSGGRVLVEIQGAFSRELSDHLASLGGQVVVGWGTTTHFRAWVPFAQLETLAGRADIKFISAAKVTVTRRIKPVEK